MVDQVASAEKLLKPNEVTACKKLASSSDSDNQRAAALLAIHSGETHAIAAEESGLSLGQLRYVLRRFRELRLEVFSSMKPKVTPKTQTVKVRSVVEDAKEKSEKDKNPKKKDKPDKKKSNKKGRSDKKKSQKKGKPDKNKKSNKKDKKSKKKSKKSKKSKESKKKK